MTIIVTGCAGFIGYHVASQLLQNNELVIGIDNINDYYDINLKYARLKLLKNNPNFIFYQSDIADKQLFKQIINKYSDIKIIIHLAAQAGVRYSLENPEVYIDSNIDALLVILEACKNLPSLKHLLFASSSSVYGANTKLPFAVDDKITSPMSLYAATKIAGEAMCYCYSSLYKIPITALRFFTVYGPWNRPDMAIYKFSKSICEGKPIHLYNKGLMKRDFTYIDDIVNGVVSATLKSKALDNKEIPYQVYNLGNSICVELSYFMSVLEQALGKKAIIIEEAMQKGDMKETFADITESEADLKFYPSTTIEKGIPKFVDWFKTYNQIVD